jgi:hypothetical protein
MKDEIEIKDYLILRSFIVSIAIVLGALSAMALDYFNINLTAVLSVLAGLGIFAVIIEYKLFLKFKKIVQTEDTIIAKQKTLINEKSLFKY